MRVLVAEDNELNWNVIKFMFEDEGVICDRATNGRNCIEMLENAQENWYDAIFMDVRMPELDGMETTKILRASKKEWIRKIPIIALTADAYAEEIQKCLNSGMNAHISKPVDENKLIEVLCRFVNK